MEELSVPTSPKLHEHKQKQILWIIIYTSNAIVPYLSSQLYLQYKIKNFTAVKSAGY